MLRGAASDDRTVAADRKVSDSESSEKDHVNVDELADRANQLFGPNGWSSEIRNYTTDFVCLAMLRTYL